MRRSLIAGIVILGIATGAVAQVPGGAPGGQTFAPPTATAPIRIPDMKKLTDPVGVNDLLVLTHQTQISPVPEYVTRAMTIQQLMGTILGIGTAGQVGVYGSGGSSLFGQGPFTAGTPVLGNGLSGLQNGAKIGTTNTFAAASGAFINGNCRSSDVNLNEIDAGIPCGGVNVGGVGQIAYYAAAGNTVSAFGSGSAGQVLTSQGAGAAPAWASGVGGITNASGSQQETTGTAGAASTALTLAAAKDFATGEGVLIVGAGASNTLAAPTGITATQVGTAGSTTYAYKVAAIDVHGGISAASAAVTTTTGNTTLNHSHYNRIAWTASAGAVGYAVYGRSGGAFNLLGTFFDVSFIDAGGTFLGGGVNTFRPPWLPSTAPAARVNDFLVTSIVSGGGATSVVLNNPTVGAVSVTPVWHDDTAAINAAIIALAVRGGTITLPPLTYNTSAAILLGNGLGYNNAGTSQGIILNGSGNPMGGAFYQTNQSGSWLNWIGGPNGVLVSVPGPLWGWGLNNIGLQCNDTAETALDVEIASFGHSNNLSTTLCGIGITLNGGSAGSSNNQFTGLSILGKNYGQWYGIRLVGSCTPTCGDTYGDNFTGFQITDLASVPPVDNQLGIGIYLQNTDSSVFANGFLSYTYGSTVAFDYTNAPYWPSEVSFNAVEPFGLGNSLGVPSFQNTGTPAGNAVGNQVIFLIKENGATCPTLANLTCGF